MGRNSYWRHPAQIELNFPADPTKPSDYEEYCKKEELWAYNFFEQRYMAKILCKLASVKLVELSMTGDYRKICPDLKTIAVDWYSGNKTLEYCNQYYARDLTPNASHPGLFYQQVAVDHWKQCNNI
jgi:hypothetical protein